MGLIRNALALLAYTSLHCVAGQSRFDCTSCQEAQTRPDGSLWCSCEVNIDMLGLVREGRAEFSSKECHDELDVLMVWNGDVVQNGSMTSNDVVTLEDINGCNNDITMQLKNLYFSEEGVYFCPQVSVCGILSVGGSINSPCVTIQRAEDTCHSLRSCTSCTTAAANCLWCDNACLPRVNNTDRCGVCPVGEAVLSSNTCPADSPSTPAVPCDEHLNSTSCLLNGCMWSTNDNCNEIRLISTPEPTTARGSEELHPKETNTDDVQGGAVASPRDTEDGFKFNEYNTPSTKPAGVVGTVFLLLCCMSCCFCNVMIGKTIQNRRFIRLKETKVHSDPSDVDSMTGSQIRVLPSSVNSTQPDDYFEADPASIARVDV